MCITKIFTLKEILCINAKFRDFSNLCLDLKLMVHFIPFLGYVVVSHMHGAQRSPPGSPIELIMRK
jgi:hypothetical protein